MERFAYLIEVIDKATAPLREISASFKAMNIAADKSIKSVEELTRGLRDTSKGVSNLNTQVNQLKAKGSILPQGSIQQVRNFNKAISQTQKHISDLGSSPKSDFGNLKNFTFGLIPGLKKLSNPMELLGEGLGYAITSSMKFEEGMAKINTTAGLGSEDLGVLSDDLRNMGVDAGYANLGEIPEAFGKILSNTNDVAQSKRILEASLKGAAIGFEDVNVLASTLTNTMSQLGKDSGVTEEQLAGVLFAAKRVGAGKVEDFAKYIPNINATAKALKIDLEESAGMFAFMTSKGIEASKVGTLMESAYGALNNADVRKGLEGIGISLSDGEGGARAMEDVMTDLATKMKGLSIDEQINLMDSIGLKDEQAQSVFALLTSDTQKLNDMMKKLKTPLDELDVAFGNSDHTTRSLNQTMSYFADFMLSLGSFVLPVLNVGLQGLNAAIGWVRDNFEWIGPLIFGIGVSFASTAISIRGTTIAGWLMVAWQKAVVIWGNLVAFSQLAMEFGFLATTKAIFGFNKAGWLMVAWQKVVAIWGNLVAFSQFAMQAGFIGTTTAIWGMTTAIFNIPLVGWLLGAIAALGAMYMYWDSFRGMINGIANTIWSIVKAIGYLAIKDFSGAAAEFKKAFSGDAYQESVDKVDAEKAQKKKEEEEQKLIDNQMRAYLEGKDPSIFKLDGKDAEGSNQTTVAEIGNSAASGGNRATQVNVTIGSLVESLAVTTFQLEEGIDEVEAKLTEMMVRILNNAQLSIR